jgi:hypothetical protein
VKTELTLAQIIRKFDERYYQKHQPNGYIQKTLRVLSQCRTAAMGGHVDACMDEKCGHKRISYNSCRNRHCPQCQSTQKENWLLRMHHRTLPVGYFHGVFTIPHEFNGLCMRYPELMYELLFKVVWATIKGFSAHPQYGIKSTGMTAVLHTWGQELTLHPHLHCIIPAGGITAEGTWKKLKGNREEYINKKGKKKKKKGFLYPIDELRKIYQAKFMAGLRKLIKQELIEKQEPKFLDTVFKKQWVIYAKQPFGGPNSVIEYLGRYTHKVAISNHRLISMDEKTVTFSYKDYADNSKTKQMPLDGDEFLRRFSQHILPKKFTKIRHFGLHAGASHKIMDALHEQLYHKPRPKLEKKGWKEIAFKKSGFVANECPCCKQNTMQTIGSWHAGRDPPIEYKNLIFSKIAAIA